MGNVGYDLAMSAVRCHRWAKSFSQPIVVISSSKDGPDP